ncbi:MAG: STAS domain-containing protein [bacterium]|nr:STAS domain-containing protein [bacterium]
MDLLHHYKKNTLVITIPHNDNRLTDNEIEVFIREIIKLNNEKSNAVAFNMSQINHFNSNSLGNLVRIKDTLADNKIELTLISVSESGMSLLNMVGLETFFNIISSEKEL